MISSTSNPQVKWVTALQKKAKQRREESLFVVEGLKMVMEAPEDMLVRVYATERFLSEHADMSFKAEPETVSENVMAAMSDTISPQGVLAVVKQPSYDIKELTDSTENPLFILLENLQDPGNLGTILRTAEGAGVSAVIMSSDTVDIYNPKVIRSTMGSIYRVPFIYTDDISGTIDVLKEAGVSIYAAHLAGKNDYDAEDYSHASGFLIGNEAKGLSDEISAKADCYIRIPMQGRVESLNASVAAALLMYEAFRQRKSS
ncbi:MAG: RNA methyltransferase [Lachnospiraceae bacterium]|nr:RNA methyltransferase [Lachnospiraceae bacterium]